ncbi:MAG: hypothetical protein F6K25_20915 [Okeania sp. SIO2G4]|uniref:hypothetical protein n=1 Tax=unclassified Okeania TaxID=2634635 RepID=UPI0013B9CE33|nr:MULTISPECIES: hypothetical protein [unclassified Okeania]NEP74272.1 hypothetical protein [Okeania sp. SIO2G5]NEP95271.1 hypothetical protein [Okeania sp. SIO2F5]NEQ92994.1 hypothetical protein [Okeania sp. SIO2G4]
MDNKLDSLLLVVLFITTMTFLREEKILINQLNDSLYQAKTAIIQQQKNHQENEQPPVPDKNAGSR